MQTVELPPKNSEIKKLVDDVKESIYKKLNFSDENIIIVTSARKKTREFPYYFSKEFSFTIIRSTNELTNEDLKECEYKHYSFLEFSSSCKFKKLICYLDNGEKKEYRFYNN